MSTYPDDGPAIIGAPTGTTAPPRTIYTAEHAASEVSRRIAAQHSPVRIVPVSFVGVARTVRVGDTRYGLPPGYRSREMESDPILFILDPHGGIHVLVAEGEVMGLEPRILNSIRSRYFPDSS